MNTLSNEDFGRLVMEHAGLAEAFQPTALYDPDGDCIEFIAAPEPFYAERVDELVTVYYSQETNEVIGSLIKGVSRFRERLSQQLPGFTIEIIDGRVKLVHIFRAKAWITSSEKKETILTYRKLIEMAEESDVETELRPAA